MLLPTIEQYSSVLIQKNPSDFSYLNEYSFLYKEESGEKTFFQVQGKNAAIGKAVKSGKHYAIRCFLNGDRESFERYELVNRFLGSKKISWKVDFDFLDNEIRIDGELYPVLVMNWVNGIHLNEYLDQIAGNREKITRLQEKLVALSRNLEENGIGHGDLNFSHILIDEANDQSIRLVDYDSIYIPELNEKRSLAAGSPGFQHPGRLSDNFSETIDRFSFWIFLAGLEAIKHDPSIWIGKPKLKNENTENFLFSFRDLVSPGQSRTFQKLRSINHKALNYYLDKLILFCTYSDLELIERPEIFNGQDFNLPAELKSSQVSLISQPAEALHEIEIKTIPAGKDILIGGIKKGITPLRLSLSKKEFDQVVILNGQEKRRVEINDSTYSYEVDFLKKQGDGIPVKLTNEPDEILEFHAEKEKIRAGEPNIISWKVRGNSRIHISNIGEVPEKTGQKKIMVRNTTDYVLTVGSKISTLRIEVEPKSKIKFQRTAYGHKPGEAAKLPDRISPLRIVIWSGVIILIALSAFLLTGYFSKDSNNFDAFQNSTSAAKDQPSQKKVSLFSTSAVTSFLTGLYDSYNKKNLQSIMVNYAPLVEEYYESGPIRNDSLGTVIKNLFLTPYFYQCRPEFSSLQIRDSANRCRVMITIRETLQKDVGSNKENYDTRIEYQLDPNFKIISEKNPG